MLARSHRLLLKINLSEWVSKHSRIVSIPPRVGHWGTYTVHIYSKVHYILLTLLRKRKMLWKCYCHGNTLLTEIISFYYYAFFQKFCTPLHSESGTPLKCFSKCNSNCFSNCFAWKRVLLHLYSLIFSVDYINYVYW